MPQLARSKAAIAAIPLVLVLGAPAWAVPGPGEAPAAAAPAADPSVTTVAALRDVGAGMWNWLTNQDGVPMSAMEPDVYDWNECAAIAHEEARELLVPEFVADIPRTDGWGHPLELCLWRPGHGRGHVMGVRSPGRDGKFQGTEYVALAFPLSEVDSDMVWMDGYFVTWPQATP